jgi:folate-binding protein YgfZ
MYVYVFTVDAGIELELKEATPPTNNVFSMLSYLHGVCEGADAAGLIPFENNNDLLGYINFHKGCYVGQELMARTKYKVPQYLCFICTVYSLFGCVFTFYMPSCYIQGVIRKRIVPFLLTDTHSDICSQLPRFDQLTTAQQRALIHFAMMKDTEHTQQQQQHLAQSQQDQQQQQNVEKIDVDVEEDIDYEDDSLFDEHNNYIGKSKSTTSSSSSSSKQQNMSTQMNKKKPNKKNRLVEKGQQVYIFTDEANDADKEAKEGGGDRKSVGEVVSINNELGIGLAVMRLECLFEPAASSSPNSSGSGSNSTNSAGRNVGSSNKFVILPTRPAPDSQQQQPAAANTQQQQQQRRGGFALVTPFKPNWWPELDLVSGKPRD